MGFDQLQSQLALTLQSQVTLKVQTCCSLHGDAAALSTRCRLGDGQ